MGEIGIVDMIRSSPCCKQLAAALLHRLTLLEAHFLKASDAGCYAAGANVAVLRRELEEGLRSG